MRIGEDLPDRISLGHLQMTSHQRSFFARPLKLRINDRARPLNREHFPSGKTLPFTNYVRLKKHFLFFPLVVKFDNAQKGYLRCLFINVKSHAGKYKCWLFTHCVLETLHRRMINCYQTYKRIYVCHPKVSGKMLTFV